MTIEKAIMLQLKNLTTMSVFNNRATSIKKVPYCVLTKISAPREYTMDGNAGMVTARLQVDIYHDTYINAKTEAEKLYVLDQYTSSIVSNIRLDNETDLFDDETKIHHVILDFIVRHYE